MPALTWQQVSNPNFSDVSDAQRLAANSMNAGFSGLSDALSKFQTDQQSQSAAQLLANAAKYQDPDALRAAVGSGNIYSGVNTSFLTPGALQALSSHATDLLSQAANQQSLNQSRIMDPMRAAQFGLGLKYDADTLGTREQHAAIETGQAGLTLGKDSATFGEDQAAKQDEQTGVAAAQRAAGQGGNQQEIDDALEADRGLTSRQRDFAHNYLVKNAYKVSGSGAGAPVTGIIPNSTVPGTPGSVTSSILSPTNPGVSTGPGGNPASKAIAGAVNPPSIFAASIPIDETRNYVQTISGKVGDTSGMSKLDKLDALFGSGPGNGGALTNKESNGLSVDPKTGGPLTSPKGAIGVAQVMPGTFKEMKAKYGIQGDITNPQANWEAGRHLMSDLLDQYGGDMEHALAAYNAGAGRVNSWGINDPDALRARSIDVQNKATQVQNDIQLRAGQNSATGMDTYAKAMRDQNTTPAQVLTQLKDGAPDPDAKAGTGAKLQSPFSGMNPYAIQEGIKSVTDRAASLGVPLTPAAAGALLAKHGRAGSTNTTMGEMLSGEGGGLLTRDYIHLDPGVDNDIKSIGDSTGMAATTASNLITSALAKNQSTALEDYKAKVQAVQQLQMQAQRPGQNAERALKQLPLAQAALSRAESIVKGFTNQAASADQYKPTYADQQKAAAALRAAVAIPVPSNPIGTNSAAAALAKAAGAGAVINNSY